MASAASIESTAVAASVVFVTSRLAIFKLVDELVILSKLIVVLSPEFTPVWMSMLEAVDIKEVPFQVALVEMVSIAVT